MQPLPAKPSIIVAYVERSS